ncbi:hypothetical protein JB92DRAFT_3098854 [Gautieria morchelliformis]|nr:hypothetical protein JB92DRAFT_3098854 [Gautieria morchelliformis]
MGNNTMAATSAFQIVGFNGSTAVPSLLQAFESLSISAMLPALNSTLLQSTTLKSPFLNTTGKQNNMAHINVNLKNPFSAGLTITSINSTVTSHGLSLGTIQTSTNFPASGKSTTTSPMLDLNMNLDPPTIFTLLRCLTVQAGQRTDQIDVIVSLGGIQYISSSDADGTKVSQKRQGNNANIFTSAVSISDYPTMLDFTQLAVPVATDDSLNLLLPILAQPIVQKFITGTVLVINTVLISTPQETAFVDAEIEFGARLTISWQGQPLGSIAMPKVQVIGDIGAQLNLSASFHITDVGQLTSFTQALLTQEDFVWDITGENLHHRTGNYLTLQTTVTNPSQVGVQLSSISFNNFVGETLLGPAASSSGFTLAPQFIATFNLPLVGHLIHQDSASGLATVSQVFTGFIHGKSTVVTVVGNSAGPSDIPFAFPIDIVALEQNIMATSQGQSFAELVIHKGPSQTDVNTHVIHLTFSDVPFAVFSDNFAVFEQFLMQTTISSSETFELSGAANTDASTAIGTLSLTGINFDVSTTIAGLQGLNTKPAVVSNLDVNHGFSDFPLIKVTTTLTNPRSAC